MLEDDCRFRELPLSILELKLSCSEGKDITHWNSWWCRCKDAPRRLPKDVVKHVLQVDLVLVSSMPPERRTKLSPCSLLILWTVHHLVSSWSKFTFTFPLSTPKRLVLWATYYSVPCQSVLMNSKSYPLRKPQHFQWNSIHKIIVPARWLATAILLITILLSDQLFQLQWNNGSYVQCTDPSLLPHLGRAPVVAQTTAPSSPIWSIPQLLVSSTEPSF